MSCLYSSPVKNLEVKSLGFSSLSSRRPVWAGLSRAESRRSSVPQRFYRTSQSARTRSPTAQASAAGCINHSARQTSTGFLREYSSAISGFRSLCGQEQRSSFSHRAQLDLRFGTFHSGRALTLRTLGTFHNIPMGYLRGQQPWTDVGRNVVAPGEYSKRFFCIPIGLYGGFFRPAAARLMPPRSALAGRSR